MQGGVAYDSAPPPEVPQRTVEKLPEPKNLRRKQFLMNTPLFNYVWQAVYY